jgi:hypothetical protein
MLLRTTGSNQSKTESKNMYSEYINDALHNVEKEEKKESINGNS